MYLDAHRTELVTSTALKSST